MTEAWISRAVYNSGVSDKKMQPSHDMYHSDMSGRANSEKKLKRAVPPSLFIVVLLQYRIVRWNWNVPTDRTLHRIIVLVVLMFSSNAGSTSCQKQAAPGSDLDTSLGMPQGKACRTFASDEVQATKAQATRFGCLAIAHLSLTRVFVVTAFTLLHGPLPTIKIERGLRVRDGCCNT